MKQTVQELEALGEFTLARETKRVLGQNSSKGLDVLIKTVAQQLSELGAGVPQRSIELELKRSRRLNKMLDSLFTIFLVPRKK